MKERRAARRIAVDVLYEAEIRGTLPTEALATRQADGWVVPTAGDATEDPSHSSTPSDEAIAYARFLVEGVQSAQAEIDELISRYADRWTIDRMPVVDRTLLRIAIFELFWAPDVPVPVAINEAVELAKSLSTEDSGRFVNGLLGRVAEAEQTI